MERREYERLKSELGTYLYIDGCGKVRGKIRDVSQTGISVIPENAINILHPESIIFLLADGMDEVYSLKLQRYDGQIMALIFVEN